MIIFILLVGMWLCVGWGVMRCVVSLEPSELWTADVLVLYTIVWPITLAILVSVWIMDKYKSRPKNSFSLGDWIRKMYGL